MIVFKLRSNLNKVFCTCALILTFSLISVNVVSAGTSGYKVAFVGDIGTASSGKATINAIVKEKPNLVVIGGDLGYSSSSSSFSQLVNQLKSNGIQVFCNIGNHDSDEEEKDSTEEMYWKLCSPGHGFWNVKSGPLTVVGLNTQCDGSTSHSKDKCTSTTIANYLKGIQENNFVVTTSHKPLCETPKSKHSAYKCTTALVNEFKRLNVDADVGAHNHCLAFDGKGSFVSGAGGRSHYTCTGWSYVNSKDYGYLLLTVTDNLDFVFKNQQNADISQHYVK